MAQTDFPEVQSAFDKYVETYSTKPTNATQLIKFCQQQAIQGVNWSKCSKFFKALDTAPRIHHKTASGPLIKAKSPANPSPNTSPPKIVVSPPTNHKRTQSALTPKSYQETLRKSGPAEHKAPMTMLNDMFTDLKEEEPDAKTQQLQLPLQDGSTNITPKKRHRLLELPWNRTKCSAWPRNRMPMTHDLKMWLIHHKFERFTAQLQ